MINGLLSRLSFLSGGSSVYINVTSLGVKQGGQTEMPEDYREGR